MSVPNLHIPGLAPQLQPGMQLLCLSDGQGAHLGFPEPSGTEPLVHFRRVGEEETLETRQGEFWSFDQIYEGHQLILKLRERTQRAFPEADIRQILRRPVGPWKRRLFKETSPALEDFRLSASPCGRYARYAHDWWLPVPLETDRLALLRRSGGRNRWIVLERKESETISETSSYRPVPFDPLSQGLRFAFGEREWEIRYEFPQGIRILLSPQGLTQDDDMLSKWMAVAEKEGEGWARLGPSPSPVVRKQEPISLDPKPFQKSAETWTSYTSPSEKRYRGKRTVVRFPGDHDVSFIFLSSRLSSRLSSMQKKKWKKMPTVDELAALYSRFPSRMLEHAVRRVVVHSGSPGSRHEVLYGEYLERTVIHYPPFRELPGTVLHEGIGHGMAPHTPAFEALWVGAMLADGQKSLCWGYDEPEEDFARSIELYFSRTRPEDYSHRYAVLDLLLHADGSPITPEDVQRAMELFYVEEGRLRMRTSS